MISEIIQRLCKDKHEVVIGYRDESYEELEERIKNGYLHIKFTQTRGGTDLGINIDQNNTNVKEADFHRKEGSLHIEGTTKLNFTHVRCIANIDLKTKKGEGYLRIEKEKAVG